MPSMMDKFKAWLQRQPDDPEAARLAEFLDNEEDLLPATVGQIDFSATPQYKQLKEQLDAQQKVIASFAASQSGQVADKAIASLTGKITPAQKPALLALFNQAAQDDADAQLVTFSVEGQDKPFEGSRVEALLAVFSEAKDLVLTTELLDSTEHAAFAAGKKEVKSGGLNPYAVSDDYKKKMEGK